MGYARAGFDIVGVDSEPQLRYPFKFIQDDAYGFLYGLSGSEFDLVHASPPCQRYSRATRATGNQMDHPDSVPQTREHLQRIGIPYVIENVPDAPLLEPLMLCGTMFGLNTLRHRLFETWPIQLAFPPATCCHWGRGPRRGVYGIHENGVDFLSITGRNFRVDESQIALGIDWMHTRSDLAQAIPPAYTEFIGNQLKRKLFNAH